MKEHIKKNFSRAAKNYDNLAYPQEASARKLVWLASDIIKENMQILDLGSGTSFIAKGICRNFATKNLQIFEVDIAPTMLAAWKQRPQNVSAICCDMENLPFEKNKFDVIFSSFALHWLKDFEKNFAQFSSMLKKNGYFAFCLPTYGSLDELRAGEVFEFHNFPEISTIKSSLENCGAKEIYFECNSIPQEFPDALSAVKFIKKIGGNSSNSKKIIKRNDLAKFNNFCLKNSRSDKSFIISWNISYFIYQI